MFTKAGVSCPTCGARYRSSIINNVTVLAARDYNVILHYRARLGRYFKVDLNNMEESRESGSEEKTRQPSRTNGIKDGQFSSRSRETFNVFWNGEQRRSRIFYLLPLSENIYWVSEILTFPTQESWGQITWAQSYTPTIPDDNRHSEYYFVVWAWGLKNWNKYFETWKKRFYPVFNPAFKL